MYWKRGLGIGLIFIGLFIILTNSFITGAVIGFQPQNYLGLFGIIIFISGILLLIVSRVGSLEEEVKEVNVYELGKGDIDEKYFMTDPYAFFSYQDINLREFRELYEVIKRDPELLEKAKEIYGKGLLSIARGKVDNSEIAKKFLEIIYERKIPKTEFIPALTKDQKEEIKHAFEPGWKKDFNGVQRDIIGKYGFSYGKTKGGHLEVYSSRDKELKTITSSTPSDWRTGRNFSSVLIKLIQESKLGSKA